MRITMQATLPDGVDLADLGEWFQQSMLRAALGDLSSGVIRDVNGNTIGTWSAA